MEKCKIGSVREIHRRLNEEGYRVSEYMLRTWVKAGKIPAVYIGNKALVSYENAVSVICAHGDLSAAV